jgi:hypothetical protein
MITTQAQPFFLLHVSQARSHLRFRKVDPVGLFIGASSLVCITTRGGWDENINARKQEVHAVRRSSARQPPANIERRTP